MVTKTGAHALADALRKDSVGGFLLIGAALVALVWANSPWGELYETIRGYTIGPSAPLHLDLTIEHWAADGILALFFFIIGAELKQEFVHGELRNPRRAMLPIVAAAGGMAVPALVFVGMNAARPEGLSGWGIPMATDIAFALAVLAIIGRHLPPALRTFLLTLAIVDDLGAIMVIAVFYTDELHFPALLASLALLSLFGYLQRGRGPAAALDRSPLPNWVVYVPLALAIWALMHESGVHATIAGVAMGMLMRSSTTQGERESPLHRAEHMLRPWSTALALPIFALMSAGVALGGVGEMLTDTVALGVFFGLVVGKLVGILGGAWLTTRLTRAELNPTLSWWDIAGMSVLAGIGFTVSLLITELAYPGAAALLENAKGGVLFASLAATLLSAGVLGWRSAHYRRSGVSESAEAHSG
ncbi:Na+/H+ antiporter NhaA [Streptomonospora wellingtoniae]|uniref:Na(+)/H(+) antiporter NhaA n=1 Tax=Streptomonospora wellingtoniae TaxID=3075544 RepID=A0ABU2KVR4_9ACTN|nr:Na+/H+ antiporter NhaA [Streptomonospora sp. DSM 45055]MDT0303143.1 Na+/H+ antiporter NhaA [Streptomonospora sp. DSM 45055]